MAKVAAVFILSLVIMAASTVQADDRFARMTLGQSFLQYYSNIMAGMTAGAGAKGSQIQHAVASAPGGSGGKGHAGAPAGSKGHAAAPAYSSMRGVGPAVASSPSEMNNVENSKGKRDSGSWGDWFKNKLSNIFGGKGKSDNNNKSNGPAPAPASA